MTTQRTRFGHCVPLFSLLLLAISGANDACARGIVLGCELSQVDPQHPENCPYVWAAEITFDLSHVDSGGVGLDFPLKIGGDSVTSLTANRNGFITFEPIEFDPSLVALTDLSANVIAPFYAPIEPTSQELTIGIAQKYDLPDDPADLVIPVGPAVAYRVTWGAANGVSMAGGPPDVTNRFQAIVIDRSDIAEGDFDLQMNYGPIDWESPPAPPALTGTATLVGLVLGDTVIDFNRYYDSFLSNGLCEEPGEIITPGSFSVTEPFVCNNITVEFRDGVGTMVGFTSDLSLTASSNADRVNAGEQVELTLTIGNSGPDDATNTNLVVGMPSGTTLVGSETDNGTCAASGAQLICELGEIATSASATVTVTAKTQTAGTFDFSSEVTADQVDPSPAGNAATVSVAADPSADLNVVSSLDPTTVNVDDATNLSLTVRNDGPNDASNVHLVVTLPAETSVDDAANLASCAETGTGLDCDLGALANGASTDLVIPLRADDTGHLSVVAAAAADEHDPDVDDNTAEAVLESTGTSDLALTADGAADSVSEGDTLNLTFTITNAGPHVARDVTLDIALPAVLEFSSGDSCTPSGAGVTCTLGDLADGDTATIEVALSATSAGSGTISAEASSAEDDPASDDNVQELDLSVTADESGGGGGGGGSIDPYALVILLLLLTGRATTKRSRV